MEDSIPRSAVSFFHTTLVIHTPLLVVLFMQQPVTAHSESQNLGGLPNSGQHSLTNNYFVVSKMPLTWLINSLLGYVLLLCDSYFLQLTK